MLPESTDVLADAQSTWPLGKVLQYKDNEIELMF